jgi:hypothetical protein
MTLPACRRSESRSGGSLRCREGVRRAVGGHDLREAVHHAVVDLAPVDGLVLTLKIIERSIFARHASRFV